MTIETIKKYKWWITTAALLIAFGVWIFMTRPVYDDIYTPKPLEGNPDATVKIVEFSDLQCPACGAAYPVTKQVMDAYGDRVSLEYKQFPLTSLHAFAFKAAEASECANDQGKFWDYVDIAFTNQKALRTSDLKNYAEQLGLDMEKFENCLDSSAKAKYVTADYNEGIGKGVGGTPTFFINGIKLQYWNYGNFSMAIDNALALTAISQPSNETAAEE